MEKSSLSGKCSTKCIIPPKLKEYSKLIISKTEKFERNLTWRMIFTPGAVQNPFKNDEELEIFTVEFRTFGFKSTKKPPPVPELSDFFVDLWKMVRSVKQRPVKNEFLNDLVKEINNMKKSKKVVVSADKSRNLYTKPNLPWNCP